jgi:hypothetical protein
LLKLLFIPENLKWKIDSEVKVVAFLAAISLLWLHSRRGDVERKKGAPTRPRTFQSAGQEHARLVLLAHLSRLQSQRHSSN